MIAGGGEALSRRARLDWERVMVVVVVLGVVLAGAAPMQDASEAASRVADHPTQGTTGDLDLHWGSHTRSGA